MERRHQCCDLKVHGFPFSKNNVIATTRATRRESAYAISPSRGSEAEEPQSTAPFTRENLARTINKFYASSKDQ